LNLTTADRVIPQTNTKISQMLKILTEMGTLPIAKSPVSIHPINQLMKYLLVAAITFSLLPINISTSTAAPNKCSTVLAQSKAALNKVSSFKIYAIQQQYDGVPPQGRSQHLNIVRGLRQEGKEAAMAKKIINNCPKIGSVSVITNGTDEEDRYGLLNGKVQTFKCKDTSETISWGEYGCS
jgi:hypothetical protein